MRNIINEQMTAANNNFNFFLMKLITLVIKSIFIISIILIINSFVLLSIVNIISIIFVIIYGVYLYQKITYYIYIMQDIKETVSQDKIRYELDLNVISNNLFNGRLNYGK